MSDLRSKMIRLASSLPKGSSERKALLKVLASPSRRTGSFGFGAAYTTKPQGSLEARVPRLRVRDWHKLVRMLHRPYYELDEATYNKYQQKLESAKTDILFDPDGRPYTVGEADGGKLMLMPLGIEFFRWVLKSKVWAQGAPEEWRYSGWRWNSDRAPFDPWGRSHLRKFLDLPRR